MAGQINNREGELAEGPQAFADAKDDDELKSCQQQPAENEGAGLSKEDAHRLKMQREGQEWNPLGRDREGEEDDEEVEFEIERRPGQENNQILEEARQPSLEIAAQPS